MIRPCVVLLAVAQVLAACGPEPNPDWMLGVFTGIDGTPGGAPFYDDRASWEQWTFRDDGVVEYATTHFGTLNEPRLRTWEVLHENRIIMFPGDADSANTRERYSWWVTRHGACGPFGYQTLSDGEPKSPEEGEIYPGEICAEPVFCPELGVDCTFELKACPGSPPPCGNDE